MCNQHRAIRGAKGWLYPSRSALAKWGSHLYMLLRMDWQTRSSYRRSASQHLHSQHNATPRFSIVAKCLMCNLPLFQGWIHSFIRQMHTIQCEYTEATLSLRLLPCLPSISLQAAQRPGRVFVRLLRVTSVRRLTRCQCIVSKADQSPP